jgi:hypothetical protein
MYMTNYIVQIAIMLAANLPIFETCSMYEDGPGCWSRYMVYHIAISVFAIGATVKGAAASSASTWFSTVSRLLLMALIVIASMNALIIDESIMKQTEIIYDDRNIV